MSFLDFPLCWFLRGLLYIAQLQFFDLAQCHYKSRSNTFVYSSGNIGGRGIVFVARNVPSFLSNDLTDIWSLQLGSVNARINGITSLDKARLLGSSSPPPLNVEERNWRKIYADWKILPTSASSQPCILVTTRRLLGQLMHGTSNNKEIIWAWTQGKCWWMQECH